jgi:uncharacterized protein
MDQAFVDEMRAGYALNEPGIVLGCPMQDEQVRGDIHVQLALSMANRHGLVAGATGTGKTKTLQLVAGQLSDAGIPVFGADVKGDLTGLAAAGDASNPKLQERVASLAWTFAPKAHPVELLSLSGKGGAQVRATVHSFGPLLLGKVLELNETQTSVLSMVFSYCDDQDLPLLDLADLRTTLRYLSSDDGKAALADYGGMSPASVGVLLRSIVTLEQEGAGAFFGEPEFDVDDLMRTTPDGRGVISLLELSDVMDKPRLFSTFMLWMLAQIYHALPEAGDLPKPKLTFFFDEAHLLFADASQALLEQIERTVRLVRSKGVGVYFVTQAPTDVPSSVLAQLGNRVEHALRAFTPEDADALRKTARTFPVTDFYDVERTITSLGTGEALVTVLSPRGVPTPLAATRLIPPDSLMAALDPTALAALAAGGSLRAKYEQAIDRDSAHERITARIAAAKAAAGAGTAVTGGGPGSVAGGGPAGPTAAEQRAIDRQAREAERELARERREAQQAARVAARAAASSARAAEREAEAERRRQAREMDSVLRAGTRVIGSRAGQAAIRNVFGTLFGGRR